jgi:small subunit ribosomal protein S19
MAEQDSSEEVMKKDLFYRGIPLEELKKLDVREVAKHLDARSRRTVLRTFDKIEKFMKRCEKKIARKKKIKTHYRDLVIVPQLVGMTISIHNGKEFQDITITSEMIGHRLGEFALTREKVNHSAAGIGATKSSKAAKK